jgi:L-lysine 2,3-aminomutase
MITDIRTIASPQEWADWHWQLRNRITTVDELRKYIELLPEEEAVFADNAFSFRMAITPYYLSLIDHSNPNDPVRMQAIPRVAESFVNPSDMADPLHEDADAPVPGMTHRYPDRVLLLLRINARCIAVIARVAAKPVSTMPRCLRITSIELLNTSASIRKSAMLYSPVVIPLHWAMHASMRSSASLQR